MKNSTLILIAIFFFSTELSIAIYSTIQYFNIQNSIPTFTTKGEF